MTCFYLLDMAKTNAHKGDGTSPGAVNHFTARCDWSAVEALISGARERARCETSSMQVRNAEHKMLSELSLCAFPSNNL